MTQTLYFSLFLMAISSLTACSNQDAVSSPVASSAETRAECAVISASQMNPAEFSCALAAEMQSIADALKTVESSQTAAIAIRKIEKSKARVKALKDRQAIFSSADEAEYAVRSTPYMLSMRTASKEFIEEYRRIAQEHPQIAVSLGPVMQGIDFGG